MTTNKLKQLGSDEVNTKIDTACKLLFKNDFYLLKNDVSERSITHRLALYLENLFHDYNVDCEFNRNGLDGRPKTLYSLQQYKKDKKISSNVYPDIIIHYRGAEYGYIAIEVKKTTSAKKEIEFDHLKLKAYKEELGYKYAFLITLPVKKNYYKYEFDKLVQEI